MGNYKWENTVGKFEILSVLGGSIHMQKPWLRKRGAVCARVGHGSASGRVHHYSFGPGVKNLSKTESGVTFAFRQQQEFVRPFLK